MRILLVFVIIFFLASCKQQEVKEKAVMEKPLDPMQSYLISKVEKFSLLSNGNIPDSNELFFYYGKNFDTSFLVHFKKEGDNVRGAFYELGFPYHNDDRDVADEQDDLLFFEGYSFKIDSSRWHNISNLADSILMIDDGRGKKDGCLDCPTYILAFNARIRNSYGSDEVLLPAFAAYLKHYLLNQYIAKRQPKMYKVK